MRKLRNVLFAIGILLVLTTSSAFAAQRISLATNPVGMALYTLGASLSEVVKGCYPDLDIAVESSNGGVQNVFLMASGDVELAFTNPLEAVNARAGIGRYKTKVPMLAVFAPVVARQQCVVLRSSGIKCAQDLRGKRVGLAPAGSMTRASIEHWLASEHMTTNDFTGFNETLSGLVEKMKNGQLDAALWLGVSPLGPLMDLAKSRDIDWLTADAKAMEPLFKEYPYHFMSELPAGTYDNQTKPLPVLAERYIVVAREDVPEDVVYKILKSAYENLDKLNAIYKGWKDCSLATALQGLNIPLHPGAVRYFREVHLPGLDEYIAKHPLN